MTIDSGDPACLAALAVEIGHAPPFSDAEIAGVTKLSITHARDISLIRKCRSLDRLQIIASELRDLDDVEDCPQLTHIEVFCSRLETLGGASFCRTLVRFDVLFTSVDDSSMVIGTSRRRSALIGNPWTELSWEALLEDAMLEDVLVDLGSQYEWSLTRELWERAGLCAGTVAGVYPLVVRPGLPRLTRNAYDALRIAPGRAASDLNDPAVTLDELFHKHAAAVEAPDLAALLAQRQLGFAGDARRWIAESALSPEDKADADRFVRRFDRLKFYRSSEQVVDRLARVYQLDPPRSYRTMTTVLDGWLAPDDRPPVWFDRFEGASSRDDSVAERPYTLQLSVYSMDAEISNAVRGAGFVIVGRSAEHTSMLARRCDDQDQRIYEFDEEDIGNALIANRDVAALFYPVFRSHAAMLGHIASVHPRDGGSISAA
jgi:hypothetical protein